MIRIVYGISSVGLGHARRSLTVARCLRELRNDIEICWISAEPVISFLEYEREKVMPVSRKLKSLSSVMESEVVSGRLGDMSRVARKSSSIARVNYLLMKDMLSNFDVLIQDEFAETMFSFMWDKNPKLPTIRVLVTDYVEFESGQSLNPLSRIVTWYANRMLIKSFSKSNLRIFADETDSVPIRAQGKLKNFEITGPILPELPHESKTVLKNKIISKDFGDGPDNRKLITVSVGGTSAGKLLIDFLLANSEEISKELDCRIIVLLGPRIRESEYAAGKSNAVRLVPFTSDNLQYYKASECVLCQAGASTLNEVAYQGVPCVVIPISNHFEQEANARRFSEKYGFPVLKYEQLSVKSIVSAINSAIDDHYSSPDFSNGASNAARLILKEIDAK